MAMTSARAWKPLLGGVSCERALEAARDIATALAPLASPRELAPSGGREAAASLAAGTAGLAVAFSHLAKAGVGPAGDEIAAAFLDSSLEAAAATEMGTGLYDGFPGIGWAASRVWSSPDDGAGDDALEEVDQEVLSVLAREPWDGPFELTSGLVGLGIYALERLPGKAAGAILARVVDHLAATAERDGKSLTWRTRPHLLPPVHRDEFPSGLYYLGVAHGVPGVIGLLAQACAAGVAQRTARPLLEGAVGWLLARRRQGGTAFPDWLGPDGRIEEQARTAWCWGDAGIAAVLSMASRCAGRSDWESEALAIALGATRRPREECRVVDGCLCHGAAGLAHMYNRIYQRTGRGELRDAATSWFEQTLAMRGDTGYGGFLAAMSRDAGGHPLLEEDPWVLFGSAGIALALTSAATAVEPAWDRMFLLSSAFER